MNDTTLKINELYAIRNVFGEPVNTDKIKLLLLLQKQKSFTPSQFKKYVDLLLFIIAYPDNKKIMELAGSELKRLAILWSTNSKWQQGLAQSGLLNTELSGKFSFKLIQWLNLNYPKQLKLDAIEAPDSKVILILSCVAGELATEILQEGHVKWKTWLKGFQSDNRENLLQVLIQFFSESTINFQIKEELWSSLEIYISLNLNSEIPNRLNPLPVFYTEKYHTQLKKQFDSAELLKEKPQEIFLSVHEFEKLITYSKMALACYQRETDPITFSSPKYCHYYAVSNGLTIALFGLPPENRKAVDCYIGYLAFKNGRAIAYGGGWILFDSCRIGINIFPAFRGGESSFIFMQIMGVYSSIYSVNRFTVDPYQIGKNNTEGINSAAFWMYYRLGFQPMQSDYKDLAAKEFSLLQKNKKHRTSKQILTKLSNSKLKFSIDSSKKSVRFDATDLSKLVRFNNTNWRNENPKKYAELLKSYTLSIAAMQGTLAYRFAAAWFSIIGGNSNKVKSFSKQIGTIKKLAILKTKEDERSYIRYMQNSKLLILELEKQFEYSQV